MTYLSAAREVAEILLTPLTSEEFCLKLLAWSQQTAPTRIVTYLNAHTLNLAFDDRDYRSILRAADLVYADGMGIVWGWRALGESLPERVTAGDLAFQFCREAAHLGATVYLLGSRPGDAEGAARAWIDAAPGLQVVGARHGYFPPEEEGTILEEILERRPNILLLGLGVPRQEKLSERWRACGIPVIWNVGALFEYFAGRRSRAPVWMRRSGLEWTWRLAQEPGRLSGRYLWGNLRFLLHLFQLERVRRQIR